MTSFFRRLITSPVRYITDLLGVTISNPSSGQVLILDNQGALTNGRVAPTTEEWDDLPIGLEKLALGAAAPDAGFLDPPDNIIDVLLFDGVNTVEIVRGREEGSHSWKLDTPLSFHLHFAPTNNVVGNIKWHLQVKIASVDGLFVNTTTSVIATTCGVEGTHQIVSFPDISTNGHTISHLIAYKIWRDPQSDDDTYPHDIALLRVGIHFAKDSWGSIQRTTKY